MRLSDGSDVTVMLAKTLTLDCPRGETGRDQLTDDSPTRLPEALRALQAGKLPRKAGMILVRQGAQYELTLQAECLSVSGAAPPKSEEERLSPHEQRLGRLESLRHLTQTLDLLFEAYLSRRTGSGWSDELGSHPPLAPGRLSAISSGSHASGPQAVKKPKAPAKIQCRNPCWRFGFVCSLSRSATPEGNALDSLITAINAF